MKLCFMALSMVSVLMFVKPVFACSHHFVFSVFPQIREKFSAWLTPAVLYLFTNCIILAILANSSFQHRFNIRGSSHDEHNPSAAEQKLQEPIYVEELTERSGTTGLEEHFFNFLIMTSCCHMSTQIQIPNPKADIISYPPISSLQKLLFNKIKKNILQTPKSHFAKQVLIL